MVNPYRSYFFYSANPNTHTCTYTYTVYVCARYYFTQVNEPSSLCHVLSDNIEVLSETAEGVNHKHGLAACGCKGDIFW